ncbi:hypothetical protein [Priestia megaterium]|uniref:hypothetical protein n=1 Tax=Priestia megaterium TaxID=1404 RepID=UPI0021D68C9A|nr:hypothetical protein [Priestia megaterium]MCU7767013.1 hypothetical protein [Priestia megaterium]
MSTNPSFLNPTKDLDIEEVLLDWHVEQDVGPVKLKVTGEISPLKIEIYAEYMGLHVGSIILSEAKGSDCISGKVDRNNKVEVCFTLTNNNSEIHVEAKACIFGKCKKSTGNVTFPNFVTIKADSFLNEN